MAAFQMLDRWRPPAAAFAVVLAGVTSSGRGRAESGAAREAGPVADAGAEDYSTAPGSEDFASGWLEWSPPPECPGVDHVEARIVEWLGRAVPPSEQLAVDGQVDWNGRAWEVAVVVRLNGRVGERRIQVSRCSDAADFVALAVVLAVDPGFVPPPPVEPTQEVRRVKREPEEATEASEPAVSPKPAPAPVAPLWLIAGAGAALAVGPLPLASGGPSAHVGLAGERWRAGMGGTFLLPVGPTVEAALRPIEFSLASGRVWGCYVLLPGHWSLSPCASVEAGVLESAEVGTTVQARQTSQFWATIGLGLEGALRVASWFQPFLGAEMSVPLTRPQFVLNDNTPVYRPAAVGFRGEVGLRFFFAIR